MLLEFKTTNYKSFKDEIIFSMQGAPKQSGLDYSLFKPKIGSKNYKVLCSAVVYGPNASGKTNIIGAMDVFKNIILRGNVSNNTKLDSPNLAACNLELIPNKSLSKRVPIKFSIKFIADGVLVDYAFAIDVGKFLENGYNRKIVFEKLSIDDELVFMRENDLEFGKLKSISKFLSDGFEENRETDVSTAKRNLNEKELFLTNGFKVIYSKTLVSLITGWLDNKFKVVYRADALTITGRINDPEENSVYIHQP